MKSLADGENRRLSVNLYLPAMVFFNIAVIVKSLKGSMPVSLHIAMFT
jgi:hypothetical protein